MTHDPENATEDATLERVAEIFGTPIYVYDLEVVNRQLERLRVALPEVAIHFAVKANPCGTVLKHLAAAGLGAEVITAGELARALRAGFLAEKIVLGGPGQDALLIQQALSVGVGLVSLDSLSELELWENTAQSNFLLRLNPALDPHTHEHLATGAATSKFGMPLERVLEAAERLGRESRLAGFHVHAGSQIDDIGVYDDILALLTGLYGRFPEAKMLDIGGGFAVPGFPLDAFSARVHGFAARFGLKLILEPGRYLVAPAGVLLTRVLHVKDGSVTHVIADAGMAELIRPALYGARHPIRKLGAVGSESLLTVDVNGPLCENADRLGQAAQLPAVKRGDLLAVEQAGAYGLTMASNYASSLRPAEVVLSGGEIRLARARETVEDLLRLERA